MKLTRTLTHGLATLALMLGLAGLNPPRRAQAGATFTVNLTSDVPDANPGDGVCETATGNGQCTLRAAVQEANALAGADTISLPAGTYLLTRAGAGEDAALTGDLDITGTLTLTGAGQAITIVDGNGLDRVFHILAGSTVTISGVTIKNGNSGTEDGGGLYNSGTLTLTGSIIISNTAASVYGNGGGLYNSGTLTLTSSTIISNTTASGYSGWAVGGGLYNYGTLTITTSTISGNTASFGGGLYNSGTLTLTGSTISGNTASFGGGLENYGTLTLTGNTVNSNTAASGGGLDNYGMLTITASTISSNTATIGGGLENFGTLTLTGSTISGNTAFLGGGLYNSGPLTLTNSTVSSNTATQDGGGGVYNYIGGNVTLISSTVSSNTATQDDGGGLFNFGTLTLTSSTISGNTAFLRGGLVNYGTATAYDSLLAGNNTDCSGDLTSQGYNLIQNTTGCTVTGTLTGVISGTDPLLGLLQANGGPTLTQALLAGSPAINAGDPAGCQDDIGNILSADQRGAPRVGRCDIGAYEAGLSASKSVSGTFRPGGRVTYR